VTGRGAGPGRITVIGLGNVLMADDAVGPYVVQLLEAAYEFGPSVTVRDLGTPGLDLLPELTGADAVIVIDTVRSSGEPGTVRLYRKPDLRARAAAPRLHPHDPGFTEALATAELAGRAPGDVVLVGVVPARVEPGPGLSPAVAAALPRAVLTVLDELARLGAEARPRPGPSRPDIWWEEPSRVPV